MADSGWLPPGGRSFSTGFFIAGLVFPQFFVIITAKRHLISPMAPQFEPLLWLFSSEHLRNVRTPESFMRPICALSAFALKNVMFQYPSTYCLPLFFRLYTAMLLLFGQ